MERIGPYRLLGEIARGAAGLVYRAHDDALGRDVAIKVLLARGLTTPLDLERFQSEARAAARLRHPGIVAVHSAGVVTSRPYLVLDLINGPTLAQHLKRSGPLPQRLAAKHAAAIARALHYAHGQGVIHRDVKPANVLLADSETPVLTDFGVAKQTGDVRGLTETGEILGTPAYMPPEQAQSHPVGPTSDVYALGATLFHALTGQAPFKSASLLETLDLIVTAPPTPPSRLRPDLDPDLEQITLRCLAKDPNDRYISAAALAGELEGWLERQTSTDVRAPTAPPRRVGPLVALALGFVAAVALSVVLGLELRRVTGELRLLERANAELVTASKAAASSLASAEPPATPPTPPPLSPSVLRGRALLAKGAWRDAIDAFARALKADPNDLAALVDRGRLWLKLYRGREAVPDLTRAVTLRPKAPHLWRDLALAYLADGDVPNAKTSLAKGIDLPSRTAKLYELRATLQDDPADTAEDLTRAIRLRPDLPRLYRQRGMAWVRAGQTRAGADDLDECLRSTPNDPLALILRAGLSDDRKRALDLLTRGTQQKGRVAADCHMARAQHLLESSPPRRREALADLARYLLLATIDDPVAIEAQQQAAEQEKLLEAGTLEQSLARARLLLGQRDLKTAEAVLAPVLVEHPRHLRALELLALVAHEQGNPKRTEALLRRALELQPQHPRLTATLIRECLAQNAIERSHQLAARALARDRENPQVLLARAEVYLQQAKHDEALLDLGQALKFDPHLTLANTTRAKVLMAETRWRAAIRELDRAIHIGGHFSDFFARGTALAKLRQNDRARHDFTQVLLQAPGHPGALLGRADAQRALGQRALAIADYREFLQLVPEAPQAKRVKSILREWRAE